MNMKKTNTVSYLYIIIAGMLWGAISIFLRMLSYVGFSGLDVVAIRITIAAVTLIVYSLVKDRSCFKIRLKDIWCFVGTGIVSLLAFTCCYFKAIEMTTAAVAAVLLYTAPSFVMIFSVFLFKERMNKNKLTALIMTFVGCVLITGIIF